MKSPPLKYFLGPVILAAFFFFSSVFAVDAKRDKQGTPVIHNGIYNYKKTSDAYWQEFNRDSGQTWEDPQSAFRDGWIEGRLEAALLINKHLSSYELQSSVDKNIALLIGEVGSGIDRQLAEQVALGINGIDSVDNRLTININLAPSTENEDATGEAGNFSQYMADVSTTAGVKKEFLKSPQIGGMAIDVSTYNGRVTLSGKVKTRQEREVAEAMAKQHKKVVKVINNLEVDS